MFKLSVIVSDTISSIIVTSSVSLPLSTHGVTRYRPQGRRHPCSAAARGPRRGLGLTASRRDRDKRGRHRSAVIFHNQLSWGNVTKCGKIYDRCGTNMCALKHKYYKASGDLWP